MSFDAVIADRLAVWDAAPAGRKPSADALCVGRPDLLPAVRRQVDERAAPAAVSSISDGPTAVTPPPVIVGVRDALPVLPNAFSLPGYPLLRKIGEGGQAVVYEALQTSTGRRVAVKVLLAGEFAQADSQRRLEREARVLAELRHPNIVSVIDRGTTPNGWAYLVMAYIAGRTLHEWLQDRWRPTVPGQPPAAADAADPAEPLRLFLAVCKAVEAAHKKGIVHRDLKPANVLVDEDGEPHVLDFGLARPIVAAAGNATVSDAGGGGLAGRPLVTVTGQFLGSLPYASPEQAQTSPGLIDARTDVYALGVILYQMLTGGRYPYSVAGNLMEVLDNIRRAAPVPPSKVLAAVAGGREATQGPARRLPAVNPGIEAIVLRALRKSPDERYATAGELGKDVASYLAGQPASADLIGRGRARPSASCGWLARIGAAVAVAGLLGFGVAFMVLRQPGPGPAASGAGARGALATTTAVVSHAGPLPFALSPSDVVNSLGMTLVRIEPGEFDMGSPDAEPGRQPNETRHHVVLTKPFRMGATEVTRGQFAAFVKATGYQTDAEKEGFAHVWDGSENQKRQGASWRLPGFEQTDYHPVVIVSWNDAVAFCHWLSEKEGKPYRLPTEAEWEYAARGGDPRRVGTTTAYPWGDDPDAGKGYANAADLMPRPEFGLDEVFSWADGFVYTAPIGSFRANGLGLHDMVGNVVEWCGDWYGEYPTGDARDPQGPDAGTARVMRGGGWYDPPRCCRPASRGAQGPTERFHHVGFRVVSDADGSAPGSSASRPTPTPSPSPWSPPRPRPGWSSTRSA